MTDQTLTRAQIEALTTDYLLELWKKNDRSQYSPETFDIIAEILEARTGSLPAQDTGIASSAPVEAEETEQLHDPDLLIKIAGRARLFATILIILAVLFLAGAAANIWRIWPLPEGIEIKELVVGLYGLLSPSIAYAAISAMGAMLLQAVAEGIYLLLDIEAKK